jgi:hypothetical protein
MLERKQCRMQHLARRRRRPAARPSVDGVADDWPSLVGEMQADLVLATCLQAHVEESAGREPLAHTEMGDGRPRRLVGARDVAPSSLVGIGYRTVDRPLVDGRSAAHEGHVAAVHAVLAEERPQRGARIG